MSGAGAPRLHRGLRLSLHDLPRPLRRHPEQLAEIGVRDAVQLARLVDRAVADAAGKRDRIAPIVHWFRSSWWALVDATRSGWLRDSVCLQNRVGANFRVAPRFGVSYGYSCVAARFSGR